MVRSNLRRSTAFRAAIAASLLLAAAAVAIVHVTTARTNAALTQATEDALQADVALLKAEYGTGGLDALARAVADKSRFDTSGLYLLSDRQGKRLAGNLADWPAEQRGGTKALIFTYRPTASAADRERTAAGLLIDLDGGARIAVARDIEAQRALLAATRTSLIVGAGALTLLGLVGGYLLSRLVLARIDRMSAATEAIMAGNLAERLPVSGADDELDRLALQLNRMLARIEQLVAGLREVSDNIAHDLKTPLNRLRNAAEAALSDQRGTEAWRQGLEGTIEQADDLIKTFNALLLIARLEAGAVGDTFERTDLASVAAGIAELYEPAAEDEGLVLDVHTAEPAAILANRHLVGQAIANLIDNAIKYGASAARNGTAAGRIEVRVTREGNHAVVTVADHGAGISPADRARAMQRFVRLDRSRSKPGTGLGLSLVAAVVQLHQGRVRLEDNAPGLRVVLSFPLAPGEPARRGTTRPATEEPINA